uniref:Uncharacterized protein n=1 Tax=Anopheles arabiensis TaxID=7173 RepID=A0A8W7MTH8_ANOAR
MNKPGMEYGSFPRSVSFARCGLEECPLKKLFLLVINTQRHTAKAATSNIANEMLCVHLRRSEYDFIWVAK